MSSHCSRQTNLISSAEPGRGLLGSNLGIALCSKSVGWRLFSKRPSATYAMAVSGAQQSSPCAVIRLLYTGRPSSLHTAITELVAEWRILETFRGKQTSAKHSDLLQISRRFALTSLGKGLLSAGISEQSRCIYTWRGQSLDARRRAVDLKENRRAVLRRLLVWMRSDVLYMSWGLGAWRNEVTIRQALWQLEAANVEELHLQLEERQEANNARFISMLHRWHRRYLARCSFECWKQEVDSSVALISSSGGHAR